MRTWRSWTLQPAVMFVRESEPFYILCLCFPYAWYVWDEKMLLPSLLVGKGDFSDNLSSRRKEFMLWGQAMASSPSGPRPRACCLSPSPQCRKPWPSCDLIHSAAGVNGLRARPWGPANAYGGVRASTGHPGLHCLLHLHVHMIPPDKDTCCLCG